MPAATAANPAADAQSSARTSANSTVRLQENIAVKTDRIDASASQPTSPSSGISYMTVCRIVWKVHSSRYEYSKTFIGQGFIGFWALVGFPDFLFVWAVRKLVGWFRSSAKLLFRFVSSLRYLKIWKFITYWSLGGVNMKYLIITGMTSWNWIKFAAGFLPGFSMSCTQKPPFLHVT